MKDKIAKKILRMEKDKLMSEPESGRDWELITALDLAIKAFEGWDELKETIKELSENEGVLTQQEVCKFLVNLMGVIEKGRE